MFIGLDRLTAVAVIWDSNGFYPAARQTVSYQSSIVSGSPTTDLWLFYKIDDILSEPANYFAV